MTLSSTAFVPALGCALLALVGTCDDDGELRGRLENARERWREQGYSDYRLTLTHDCFCGFEGRGPVVVVVRFGEVVSRTYQETGEPVAEDFAPFFPDVEGLFEFVEDAIERDAVSIRAEFHPELGYPTIVAVDYAVNIADEERGYHVLAIEPLRAGDVSAHRYSVRMSTPFAREK